jgi:hypothetical protein
VTSWADPFGSLMAVEAVPSWPVVGQLVGSSFGLVGIGFEVEIGWLSESRSRQTCEWAWSLRGEGIGPFWPCGR